MNKLQGTIVGIDSNEHMSIVDVAVGVGVGADASSHVCPDVFTAALLETPASASYLVVGTYVSLIFKETEVSLAKNLSGEISMRNRIAVKVAAIERGAVLSAITLDYAENRLVSVITTRAVDRLRLQVGDHIEALIKSNEVMLSHDV